MALFGLYQAIFAATAAPDNAKKIVETELRAGGTDPTPRRGRRHVAIRSRIPVGRAQPGDRFTTLFGVLAVGLSLELQPRRLGSMSTAWRSPFRHRRCSTYALRGRGARPDRLAGVRVAPVLLDADRQRRGARGGQARG
jgi:hypothetical protein